MSLTTRFLGISKAAGKFFRKAGRPTQATAEEVMAAERRLIQEKRNALISNGRETDTESADADQPAKQQDSNDFIGLSLSGGGIRSGTFNLGILQALAELRLIRHLDYLSTVSGGGYIGGWLTALIHRLSNDSKNPPGDTIAEVEKTLSTENHDDNGNQVEDHAISYLRRYSNYLTPKFGFLTMDTWQAVAIYLRNVLLNLTILIPILCAIFMLPLLLSSGAGSFSEWVTQSGDVDTNEFYIALIITTTLLYFVVSISLGYNFAAFVSEEATGDGNTTRKKRPHNQSQLMLRMIAPMLLIATLTSLWLPQIEKIHAIDISGTEIFHWHRIFVWGIFSAALYFLLWAIAWLRASITVWYRKSRRAGSARKRQWRTWLKILAAGVITGFFAGMLLWLMASGLKNSPGRIVSLTVGPPLMLLWLYVSFSLHTGLVGRAMPDYQREWLGRMSGWLLIIALVWFVLFGLALIAPLVLLQLKRIPFTAEILTSGWLVTTIGGLLAGRSSKPGPAKRLLISAAPYVFLGGLMIAVAGGLHFALSGAASRWSDDEMMTASHDVHEEQKKAYISQRQRNPSAEKPKDRDLPSNAAGGASEDITVRGSIWPSHVDVINQLEKQTRLLSITWLGLLLIALVLSRQININAFSMHNFYGNRLIRCYLGASIPENIRQRNRQPFTGFYEGDDYTGLADYESSPGPYPIINTAINLVSGEELAWQERKAASFILSPLYCGFQPAKTEVGLGSNLRGSDSRSYRSTNDFAQEPTPLTLGNAITTSGAAASPNMGFRTTSAFAFLMTLFNVRLGRWIENPRNEKKIGTSSPKWAIVHLFYEVFGLTKGDKSYVYLSDGGHFENLGIYELVRRRCRYIIACDAGADPELKFDDLGNAIRKCRADFGVNIKIDLSGIKKAAEKRFSPWYCAVGDIEYERAGDRVVKGTLVYIKATITGCEPEDVLNYARQHARFPHQSTGDQFFSEAQFESYRALGHHIGHKVFDDAVNEASTHDIFPLPDTDNFHAINRARLFMWLSYQWAGLSGEHRARFTQHSQKLDEIFERLRTTRELRFLNRQIYPEWAATAFSQKADAQPGAKHSPLYLPKTEEEFTHGFYLCNSLIQLMENVYLDLELENQWEHPDNRGWVNLFKHWSWSGMFRVTWAISAGTYGNRFQLFCENRLQLRLGQVKLERTPLSADAADNYGLESVLAEDQQEPTGLNFLEQQQIRSLIHPDRKTELNMKRSGLSSDPSHNSSHGLVRPVIFQLLLAVTDTDESHTQELFRFGFGYALVDEGPPESRPKLKLLRVQDHLRKMGLAREATLALMRHYRGRGLDFKASISRTRTLLKRWARDDFTAENLQRYQAVFESARQEIDAEQRLAEVPAPK